MIKKIIFIFRRGGGRDYGSNREYDDNLRRAPSPGLLDPPSTHSIDINCVQDFPSLNGTGSGPGPGGGNSGSGGNSNKSIAHKLAQQNRLTIRTSTGGAARGSEEEFPSLGSSTSVTVSTAPSSPTTSLHLHVNTKKAAGQGNNIINSDRGANVSIKYNTTIPGGITNPSISYVNIDSTGSKASSVKATGSSQGTNIMVKTSSDNEKTKMNKNNKVKKLEEDFPALSIIPGLNTSKPSSGNWVFSSDDFAAPLPSPSKSLPNKQNNVSTNKKPFKEGGMDFPSLKPNSQTQQNMKNYHGRSSVTIPVTNAWTNSVEHVPKASDAVSGSNNKGKKKKKNNQKNDNGFVSGGNVNNNTGNYRMTNGKTSGKKKPLALSNIFDDSDDEDGPKMNFSAGKLGEYESVASHANSNINLITQDMINNRGKSELNIGTLKSHRNNIPSFNPEDDFPSLDSFPSLSSNLSCSNNNNKSNKSVTSESWRPNNSKKNKNNGNQNKRNITSIQPTDMTFTSSSGEKFAISPTTENMTFIESETASLAEDTSFLSNTISYTFSPPPKFEIRNKNLIQTITNECAGNQGTFEEFKHLANQLRTGDLHGREYYVKCSDVIGKSTFHRILPELLGLLPDIKKQQVSPYLFLKY